MTAWWTFTGADCVARLNSSGDSGLDEAEARRRLLETGPNALAEKGIKSPWRILAEQLSGALMIVLLIAAAVSAALGETLDAVVILAIVLLNALLGLSQEYRAEKAMAALKKMSAPRVKVRRGGNVREIPSTELVPGDLVLLESGNLVPADARLLEAVNLRIQEAALTGESEPVEKSVQPLSEESPALGDRANMAYMGTVVSNGRGLALIVATGMSTELGGIATLMQAVKREATPLQKRLAQLGRSLAVAALAIVAVIFAEGLLQGGTGPANLKVMFMTAISMAVAAVPEGLPAVVTIALALGAQRMLGRRALIRKLLAVETLGSVTVICSDKTGTLTENRMTVTAVHVAGQYRELPAQPEKGADDGAQPAIPPLLAAAALCNDATLNPDRSAPPSAVGDPTETALVVVAARYGLFKPDLDRALPRTSEKPFDSERKRMTTVHQTAGPDRPAFFLSLFPTGEIPPFLAFCKGAVDGILPLCTSAWGGDGIHELTGEARIGIMAAHDEMAGRGMRILGVAYRPLPDEAAGLDSENNMIFIGLIGMIDPPRPEAKAAIHVCQTAGIRSIMITGDHPLTASEIARNLDIPSAAPVLTGKELSEMTDEQLTERLADTSVFARVAPEHKLRIVEALQKQGHVTAMTGDGVNDAPALRKADIGVAMGITGTDVSKEASDMVLMDDHFATIVAAVEEGRIVYDNIRKVIAYLLGTNSGELWVMLLAPLLGMPIPLVPIQILWMNLVTDGLPALSLSVEPAEKDVMLRPPRPIKGSIFGDGLGLQIIWVGLLMAFITLGAAFGYMRAHSLDFSLPADCTFFRTIIFTIMTFLQMANLLSIRSGKQSLFSKNVRPNRLLAGAVLLTILLQAALLYLQPLRTIFKTTALSLTDLLYCMIIGSLLFWSLELSKWLRRRGRRSSYG